MINRRNLEYYALALGAGKPRAISSYEMQSGYFNYQGYYEDASNGGIGDQAHYVVDPFGFLDMWGFLDISSPSAAKIFELDFAYNPLHSRILYGYYAGDCGRFTMRRTGSSQASRPYLDADSYSGQDYLGYNLHIPLFTRGWLEPTFENSWVNYSATATGGNTGGTAEYAPAGYFKDPLGFVHLQGLVKNGTAGATIFTLPEGYRPAKSMIFKVVSNGGAANLWIHPDGSVDHASNSSHVGFFSLEGIYFLASDSPLENDWIDLTEFSNSWTSSNSHSGNDTFDAQILIDPLNRVHFRGGVENGTAGGGTEIVDFSSIIPAGTAPDFSLIGFNKWALYQLSASADGTINVGRECKLFCNSQTLASNYISLDQIHLRRKWW